MVGLVDVHVWELDPQKYADAAVHSDFLTPLALHEAVALVVLNQIDRLPDWDLPSVPESPKASCRGAGWAGYSHLALLPSWAPAWTRFGPRTAR